MVVSQPAAQELTLQLEYTLNGLPASHPLVVVLEGHLPESSWPIQEVIRFGGTLVNLTQAKLSTIQSGPPSELKKFLQLELSGENARWGGAQLICLNLDPGFFVSEFEAICGQEPGGIMAAVTLGEPVGWHDPLPLIPASVQFDVTGDILFQEPWETSFPIGP